MSDYHHRMKMDGTTCHVCEEGTITGGAHAVSCDNDDCHFNY